MLIGSLILVDGKEYRVLDVKQFEATGDVYMEILEDGKTSRDARVVKRDESMTIVKQPRPAETENDMVRLLEKEQRYLINDAALELKEMSLDAHEAMRRLLMGHHNAVGFNGTGQAIYGNRVTRISGLLGKIEGIELALLQVRGK